ncbi:MAG: hypothetical protein V7672_11915 [Brevundimonas sp.]|uniref:hypothetical protein n=1 Tax=Brevundimonas sp. TaxID=1871086 RepID=UPI00300180D1
MSPPDQYRRLNEGEGNTDPNASTPVFDPVLASGQADAEAGGAIPVVEPAASPAPERRSHEAGQTGLRLPMWLWLTVAGTVLGVLLVGLLFL